MEPRRRINLLPAEIGEKNRQRQVWVYAIIGLAALIGILAVITLLRAAQAKSVRDQANKQEQKVKELELKARELEYLDELQRNFDNQKKVVQSVWLNEVSWPKVLQEIAATMPDGVYLTSFKGLVDPEAGKKAPASKPISGGAAKPSTSSSTAPKSSGGGKEIKVSDKTPIGTVQVSATAKSHRDVANWLYRVNRNMPSMTYAWITSQTLKETSGEGSTSFPVVTFQGTSYLTPYSWGWMGRCAARGFDNLAGAGTGSCGHSYYGAGATGGASRPTTGGAK
ncbi:MAG: hypothetical protein DCC49_04270 [Acidobacteria bacterium]|nr:MAG: hypothetical protein DCC49_04270 [Acidobacteriota bacterium]